MTFCMKYIIRGGVLINGNGYAKFPKNDDNTPYIFGDIIDQAIPALQKAAVK